MAFSHRRARVEAAGQDSPQACSSSSRVDFLLHSYTEGRGNRGGSGVRNSSTEEEEEEDTDEEKYRDST
ncbi:unnamed protein product [Rangifer tarandus platyrhynchus]|uniref:Uncharacterized protein n=1 Tax=Rangifer tarandus platyrhynchus TaxID=3082113 RepID=A0ABN8XNA5_RANTA|nr:unnamed protein product [Rangifer tarandus platyrhynchus]